MSCGNPNLVKHKAKIAQIMKHNAKRDIKFISARGWINLLVSLQALSLPSYWTNLILIYLKITKDFK